MNLNETGAEAKLVKHREKLEKLFDSKNALNYDEILIVTDLNQHREWLQSLVKNTSKLKSSLAYDFINELEVMRKSQLQLTDLIRHNEQLEEMNAQLNEELSELKHSEHEAQHSTSILKRITNDNDAQMQNHQLELEQELAKMQGLLETSDSKLHEIEQQLIKSQREAFETKKIAQQFQDKAQTIERSLQDVNFNLQEYKESLRDSQATLKKREQELEEKDVEFTNLSIEHVRLQRQNSEQLDKQKQENEMLQDKLKTYKKFIERANEDKDRYKKKIKEGESKQAELEEAIASMKRLQEIQIEESKKFSNLNLGRKTSNSLSNRTDLSADTSVLFQDIADSEAVASIDPDGLFVSIMGHGGRQLKIRLQKATDTSYVDQQSNSSHDNSMLQLELMENQPRKTQNNRFQIHAVDFDEAQQQNMQGPRNAQRMFQFNMADEQDELDDQNEIRGRGLSLNYQEQEHFTHPNNRSYISNQNNSFFEGIQEIQPPKLGKKPILNFQFEEQDDSGEFGQQLDHGDQPIVNQIQYEQYEEVEEEVEDEELKDEPFLLPPISRNKAATNRFSFNPGMTMNFADDNDEDLDQIEDDASQKSHHSSNQKLKELIEKQSELQIEIESVRLQLANKQDELQSSQKQIISLESQFELLNHQNQDLVSYKIDQELVHNELKAQVEKKKLENEDLQLIIDELRDKRDQDRVEIVELQDQMLNLSELSKQTITDLETERDNLTDELKKLEKKSATSENTAQIKLSAKTMLIDDLQRKFDQANQKITQVELENKQEVNLLEKQLDQLRLEKQTENEVLKEEMEMRLIEQQILVDSLNNQIKDFTEQQLKLEKIITQLRSELESKYIEKELIIKEAEKLESDKVVFQSNGTQTINIANDFCQQTQFNKELCEQPTQTDLIVKEDISLQVYVQMESQEIQTEIDETIPDNLFQKQSSPNVTPRVIESICSPATDDTLDYLISSKPTCFDQNTQTKMTSTQSSSSQSDQPQFSDNFCQYESEDETEWQVIESAKPLLKSQGVQTDSNCKNQQMQTDIINIEATDFDYTLIRQTATPVKNTLYNSAFSQSTVGAQSYLDETNTLSLSYAESDLGNQISQKGISDQNKKIKKPNVPKEKDAACMGACKTQ